MISATAPSMLVTSDPRSLTLRDRLQDKLDSVRDLRCGEHGAGVAAVIIDARENGWFDCRWTTCCERLEREAAKTMGSRC